MDQVPWPLQEAINHGLTILSWYENYLPEEMPPENLWDDGEAIEDHFRRVRERKEAERDGIKRDDDDDDLGSGMTGNDLSSVFKE